MKYIKFKAIIILVVLMVAGSCTNDFIEMNTDPNNPVLVPATNVLASALWYQASNNHDEWSLGNEHGSYAGHISKIQYIDESRYQYRETVVNDRWTDYYNVLNDLKKVIELAVRRMLPKNKLGKKMLKKLKVYRGSEHDHQAQQPETIELS